MAAFLPKQGGWAVLASASVPLREPLFDADAVTFADVVAAMHKVAQRPPVHAAGLCRQTPRRSVPHPCNRQNAPRLLGIRRACRRNCATLQFGE